MKRPTDSQPPDLGAFSLAGRVVLVTGATGRVGRIIATALCGAGAHLLVGSRRKAAAAEVVASLSESGGTASPLVLDPASVASVERAVRHIKQEHGRIDALFNNAVAVSTGRLEAYAVKDWIRVMRCNSTSLFVMCQTFGRVMSAQGFGTIVNVGSIYGVVSPSFDVYRGLEPFTSPPSYAFAKGGMIQLTRYLATYLGPHGVTVNCLSLGGLRSKEVPPQLARRYGRRTALGRMAEPADFGPAAVFLAGVGARYITGQNVVVDGGYSAA